MEKIKFNYVKAKNKEIEELSLMKEKEIKKVRNFHKSFDEYEKTPLISLNNLAKELGVNSIYVKDESHRFKLNAFKVLGASYAMAKYLADKLGKSINEVSFEYFNKREVKDKLGDITFVTATDGNHGRGVAWAANKLGQKSVVYMPKGSSKIRLNNIRREGAEASIIDGNYDDAVRKSEMMSKKHGWVVIQDTAWDGYVDIPNWIMQGYGTIGDEIVEDLKTKPTHIILQAGVGSFAGSMVGYFTNYYKDDDIKFIVVEPNSADCIYRSSLKGEREIVEGDMNTIMAGLACGEPNIVSYEILKNQVECYVSSPDYVAAKGMRILANPLSSDEKIISGESGAIGLGLLHSILKDSEYKLEKGKLNLNKDSNIVLISTEGDTDPQIYKDIIWKGIYPST